MNRVPNVMQPSEAELMEMKMLQERFQSAFISIPYVACKNCGCEIFTQGIKIKQMSKLHKDNFTGEPQIATMKVFYCAKCFTHLDESQIDVVK